MPQGRISPRHFNLPSPKHSTIWLNIFRSICLYILTLKLVCIHVHRSILNLFFAALEPRQLRSHFYDAWVQNMPTLTSGDLCGKQGRYPLVTNRIFSVLSLSSHRKTFFSPQSLPLVVTFDVLYRGPVRQHSVGGLSHRSFCLAPNCAL